MKSTILLAATIFLVSAPTPDSKTVSEVSGGFLSNTNELGLMASEPVTDEQANPVTTAQLNTRPATEQYDFPAIIIKQAALAVTPTKEELQAN